MSTGPLSFADSLAFLVSQVGAHSARLFSERLTGLGISPREFGALSNLAAADGQTQQELADALSIHRNNMVGLVDRMEALGWVRRERGVADRRAFHLRLTPAGRKIVARVNELAPALDAELSIALDEGERRELEAQLKRVAASVGLKPGVHPSVSAGTKTSTPGAAATIMA